MTCPLCDQGPKGIGGHAGMVMEGRADHATVRVTYRCTRCGGAYLREYEGGGVFAWVNIAAAHAY